MSALVLIVEDEADLVTTLEYALQKDGYQTRTAMSGGAALEALAETPKPDLVLLDLMLPDMSGTEVCRKIRSDESTLGIPVVMLTAKTDEIDRVVGFEVGADDYVTKPYSVRELLLRIRAVMRRSTQKSPTTDRLEFGPLRLDRTAHRVWIGDDEVALTALEFKLLTAFVSRKGRVQSREALLSDVWGIDADVTTRTVDTHVKRLREKLGHLGGYIETLRGVGYRFRERPEES